MKYHRLTVEKWKYHASLSMLGLSLLMNFMQAFSYMIDTANAKDLISPAPSDPTIVKEITKTEYVEPQTVEAKIISAFGKDAELALEVARCESGLDPRATNKTSSARGLFQVMQSWHKIDQKWLYDADINIKVAKQLFDESGGSFLPHWSASANCWSK